VIPINDDGDGDDDVAVAVDSLLSSDILDDDEIMIRIFLFRKKRMTTPTRLLKNPGC